MIPQNLNFGGSVAETVANPAVLAIVFLAGILLVILPRRTAIIPFITVAILIPTNQVLVVAGAHFQMMRVLAVFGLVRVCWAKFSKGERIFSGGLNGIDWAVIALTVFSVIDGLLLWQSQSEFIFQVGNLLTAFGCYFLLRHFLRNREEIWGILKPMAWIVAFIAVMMIYEHATGRNPYYQVLGGVAAEQMSVALSRADLFRARGCFAHPVLAGAFGGFMLPLFVGWWKREKKSRKYMGMGIVGALTIPFLTGSSTGLFALLAGIGALFMWPLRRRLRFVRWGIVLTLVAGQLYMKSPVWHLIDDVTLSADSSSYHRFQLVNQCILHFWDWVLVGTKNYASWGWDMWDLSNQYVFTADTVGLIPLIALICILVFGFKYIGRARKMAEGDKSEEFLIWAVGASLFANLVAFFGISYFDQTIVAWYALLAIISAVTLPAWSAVSAAADKKSSIPVNVGFVPNRPSTPAWLANPAVARFRTPPVNLTTRPR